MSTNAANYWKTRYKLRAAESEALIREMLDAMRGSQRLSEMGFEESLNEPEESGNYAAYNRMSVAITKATAYLERNADKGGEVMADHITNYNERELEDDYPIRPGFLYVVDDKVWRCPPIARTLTAKEIKAAGNNSVKNCDIQGRDIWHLAI